MTMPVMNARITAMRSRNESERNHTSTSRLVGDDMPNARLNEIIQNLGILIPSVPTIANDSGDDIPVLERGQLKSSGGALDKPRLVDVGLDFFVGLSDGVEDIH